MAATETRISKETVERELFIDVHQVDQRAVAGAVLAVPACPDYPVPNLGKFHDVPAILSTPELAMHEGTASRKGIRREPEVMIDNIRK